MRCRPAFLLVLCTIALHAQTKLHFTAHVHGGERFVQPLRPGLFFIMQPVGGDWRFSIAPKQRSDDNFADCVNGSGSDQPSPLDLLAWRFSPKADASFAQHTPAVQEFHFVTDSTAEEAACKAAADAGEGMPFSAKGELGTARVTVQSAQLKPGPQDFGAAFAEVQLDIDILLSPKAEGRP